MLEGDKGVRRRDKMVLLIYCVGKKIMRLKEEEMLRLCVIK